MIGTSTEPGSSGKVWLGYFDSMSFGLTLSPPCDFLAFSFNISARFRGTTTVFCGVAGGIYEEIIRKIRKTKAEKKKRNFFLGETN